MTLDEIRSWPPTVDVATAAKAIGISRAFAYELARRGDFPVRCIRIGNRYRVPTNSILALLEGEPT